jgi:hypothetical protein
MITTERFTQQVFCPAGQEIERFGNELRKVLCAAEINCFPSIVSPYYCLLSVLRSDPFTKIMLSIFRLGKNNFIANTPC